MTQGSSKASPVAIIDEEVCIGCTLCIEACPVDAIVGAAQRMHTVIAQECTGCRLCLPPCPVDCIAMVATGETWTREQRRQRAAQYRRRHEARVARLQRKQSEQPGSKRGRTTQAIKQATIERVMQRARQRLRERNGSSGKA